MKIVFWQSMISRHQAALVRALADMPEMHVTYIAAEDVDERRARMGWTAPDLGNAVVQIAPDEHSIARLAASFDWDAIHICQGFRGNGPIEAALPVLAGRGARIGVMMETVDQRGAIGWLKGPAYWKRIRKFRDHVQFCLAIGQDAAAFVAKNGYPAENVFRFTYFLHIPAPLAGPAGQAFRFVFAGSLVHLKRVDLLIEAVGLLEREDATLTIVGDGPLRSRLEAQANKRLAPDQATWRGALSPAETQEVISQSDCLVLPSEYDGWGAVVSEALLAGVPAVCSDACGAAEAVAGSGYGGVFRSQDALNLSDRLRAQLAKGTPGDATRREISSWARSAFSGEAGADYLSGILHSVFEDGTAPRARWLA